MAVGSRFHSSDGVVFALSGSVLFIISIVLLTFSGQTWSALTVAIGHSSFMPPVVRIESRNLPNDQSIPTEAVWADASYVYRVAFWALVLNLLTAVFSMILMFAAMFFRECGQSRRRSHYQRRIGSVYISEIVLWCNAAFALVAFLSTTILHEQSRNGFSFTLDPPTASVGNLGPKVTDVESLGCRVHEFDDLCANGAPMRYTLIPYFLIAILVAILASSYLRKEERREAERAAGLHDAFIGDVDVDIELAPPSKRPIDDDRRSNVTAPPSYEP